MKSLKSLLGNNKKYLSKKKTPEKEVVFFIFKEAIREYFGEIGSGKFIPDHFSNGNLFVKAENSMWSSELWMNREKIIKKINEKIGEKIVKEIKMK